MTINCFGRHDHKKSLDRVLAHLGAMLVVEVMDGHSDVPAGLVDRVDTLPWATITYARQLLMGASADFE